MPQIEIIRALRRISSLSSPDHPDLVEGMIQEWKSGKSGKKEWRRKEKSLKHFFLNQMVERGSLLGVPEQELLSKKSRILKKTLLPKRLKKRKFRERAEKVLRQVQEESYRMQEEAARIYLSSQRETDHH